MHTINNSNNEAMISEKSAFLKETNAFQLNEEEEEESCDKEICERGEKSSCKSSSSGTKKTPNTENESGFSSMCSFFVPSLNEIGLPFSRNDVIFNVSNLEVAPSEIDVLWV